MSRKIVVNPGDIFNMLTVIEEDEPYINRKGEKSRMVLCQCICGNIVKVQLGHLRIGHTRSCGCYAIETAKICGKKTIIENNKKCITHGDSKSMEYRAWKSMKQRCYNTKVKGYKNYGGRGITVCDRWRNSYENFLEDMGRKPDPEYSIDRIDNDGNYEPGNCRWATRLEQSNNQRHVNMYTKKG